MSNDMRALIARIEAATGPEWMLDRAISDAINYMGGTNYTPAFSASTDAITLNIDSGYWEISGPRRYLNIPTPVPNYWRAELSWFDKASQPVVGWGATEALARRAAELRARLAMMEPRDE